MLKTSVNLPVKYRLDLTLVRSRNINTDPVFPSLGNILRAKKGSKISRYFRHIFEQKKVKKFLGANLALGMFATSLISPTGKQIDLKQTVVPSTSSQIILNTSEKSRYPVEEVKITQNYSFYHPGLDLDGLTGDPIRPIREGFVTATGYSKVGYGNSVLIDHGANTVSLYAHLSKINVKAGDQVSTRSIIGSMGATGRAFGDHLHLEIYVEGKAVNPVTFIGK